MRDAKDTNMIHDALWKIWDALPDSPERDHSIFNGYKGLIQQYDAEIAKAHLRTMNAQGKVSDKVFEAIMVTHGVSGK